MSQLSGTVPVGSCRAGWAGGQPGPNVPMAAVATLVPTVGEHGAALGAGAWAGLPLCCGPGHPPGLTSLEAQLTLGAGGLWRLVGARRALLSSPLGVVTELVVWVLDDSILARIGTVFPQTPAP